MKTSLPLVAVSLTLSLSAPTLAQDAAKTSKAVLAAERQWFDAVVKRDGVALDRAMASEYVSVNLDGSAGNKSQSVSGFTGGTVTYLKIETSEEKVLPLDSANAAVVSGISTWKTKYNGQTSTGRMRHTEVWTMRDGRWQVVAWHGTVLPNK